MLVNATAKLKSVSPYSPSAPFRTTKPDELSYDDFDAGYWKEHAHVGQSGNVIIPPMSFKQALERAAVFLSMKVPEKRGQTYSKRFLSGILIVDEIDLGIKPADLGDPVKIYASANGTRGAGGKRVWRRYPIIPSWSASLVVNVIDPDIGETVLKKHLDAAGRFVGVGRFRPQNGGFNGRFEVIGEIKWEEIIPKE